MIREALDYKSCTFMCMIVVRMCDECVALYELGTCFECALGLSFAMFSFLPFFKIFFSGFVVVKLLRLIYQQLCSNKLFFRFDKY